MFYEKNFNFITKRYPFLQDDLQNVSSDDIVVEVERSKTGLPVARVSRMGKKVYLHSLYDPELDARRWVANQVKDAVPGNMLVCGAGFLYHLKCLIENGHFQKIIVYEPSLAVFKACMRESDLEPLFGSNVLLILGDDFKKNYNLMISFLGKDLLYNQTKMHFTSLPAYKDIFQAELDQFKNRFAEYIKIEHFNLATTVKFNSQWLLNEFNNLRTIADTPVLRHFVGQFKNIPAIIVSAGPSLEKNVHLLNQIKENALIICAGSSIRAMQRNGVSPHFQVVIDPSELNMKLYEGISFDDLYFLYCFNFYYGVVNQLHGKKVIFQTNTELFPAYVAKKLEYEFGTVCSGFSCSHTCLDLAYYLGCNPIIMIGQDLAYTGKKRYAEGHNIHQKYLGASELPPDGFISKDIYGQDIITDKALDGFRAVFEEMIAGIRGQVEIINATEGGIPIQGTFNRKLADVLAEYCRQDRGMNGYLQSLYNRGLKELRNRKIDPKPLASKLKVLMDRGICQMEELIDRIQQLRCYNFFEEVDFTSLEALLANFTSAYDLALNYEEYHILLKPLQSTNLSINRNRAIQTGQIKTKSEYDERLQNYLMIISETKKSLEYISESIAGSFEINETEPQIMEETDEIRQLERKIRDNDQRDAVCRQLENRLKHTYQPVERSKYLYLLGLADLYRGRTEQAIVTFEETLGLQVSLVKTYLALGKLYYRVRNFTRAQQCLAKCREYGYKSGYCLKMMIKIHYLSQDYVAANNLLADYQRGRPNSRKLETVLKIICLIKLELSGEAVKTYQELIQHQRLSTSLDHWLKSQLNALQESEYSRRYAANATAFKKRGLDLSLFADLRYQMCRFLGGEILYDSLAGKFVPGLQPAPPCNLRVWLEDILVVHDADNPDVFQRLQDIKQEIKSAEIQSRFENIPTFVIDHDREHWEMMMQAYDFSRFTAWENMHFFIGLPDQQIQQFFLEEHVPFPNVLYGMHPERFEQLLQDVKMRKDELYGRRIGELREYYRQKSSDNLDKVLLVYHDQDRAARFYAETVGNYMDSSGISRQTLTEQAPYYKLTAYANARALLEFQPDLIIGLNLCQEEIAALNEIALPFTGWMLAEKSLDQVSRMAWLEQRLSVSGNLQVQRELASKGFPVQHIREIPLPVIPWDYTGGTEKYENDIGIVSDFVDTETTLNNLEIAIYGILVSLNKNIRSSDIAAMLKGIYFQLATQDGSEELSFPEQGFYETVIAESLARNQIMLEQMQLSFVAALLKQELEQSYSKSIQVKWLIDNLPTYRLAICGDGWRQNESLQSYFKGPLNFFSEPVKYQQFIVSNKINLYLGHMIKNHSYRQPDLIQGIAAGGFFLVNHTLERESESENSKNFKELLEVYANKEQMIAKIEYFLNHPEARNMKRKKLQDYVRTNYAMEKVMDSIFKPIHYIVE